MANLHFDITADCSSATTALNNTRDGISSLNGQVATTGVVVTGTDAAVGQLNSVGAARSTIAGITTVDVQVGPGVAEAERGVQGLRNNVMGLNNDLASVTSPTVGVAGSGSVRQMTADLDAMSGGLQRVNASSEGLAGVDARAGAATQTVTRLGSEIEALGDESAMNATAPVRELAMALGGNTDSIASGGAMAASAASGLNARLGGVGASAELTSKQLKQLQQATSALDQGSLRGGFGSFAAAYAGQPGTGPPFEGPPTGRGGGGGGGGGTPRTPGGAAKPEEMFADSEGLGGPAMLGGMLGIAADAIYAAAGIGSVAEAVGKVPGLAFAAGKAMFQFDTGVRQAAAGALSQGVPAFQSLGTALRPLGTEIGQIGAQNLGTTLAAATDVVGHATNDLKAMEGAIGPAITGFGKLADSILDGIASPQVSAGVQQVSKSLSDPGNEEGIKNLTTGALALGTTIATVVTDAAGAVGQLTGIGGQAAVPAALAGLVGAFLGKGGGFVGMLSGAGLAGLGAAITQGEVAEGRSPTDTIAGGVAGYGLAGLAAKALPGRLAPYAPLLKAGGAMLGMSAEDMLPPKAADITSDALTGAMIGAQLGMPFGPEGALIGGGIGLVAGAAKGFYDTSQQGQGAYVGGFPTGVSAPHGWDMDKDGNLTPSKTTTMPSSGPVPTHMPEMAPPPGPTPLPSTGDRSLPPEFGPQFGGALPPLTSDTNAANQSLQNFTGTTNTAAPAMANLTTSTQGFTGQMQRVPSAVQPATQALTNLQQQAQPAAQAVQQVPQAMQPTMDLLQQFAPQATAQISQATTAVSSGATNLGNQIPAQVGQGIQQSTPEACDAAADMGKQTGDCGKSALQSASPSQVFAELGMSTGQGLALGIQNSTGLATTAVGSMMTSAVGAGAAAIGAASPSKAFTALGQDTVGQMFGAGAGQALGAAGGFGSQLANQLGIAAGKSVPRDYGSGGVWGGRAADLPPEVREQMDQVNRAYAGMAGATMPGDVGTYGRLTGDTGEIRKRAEAQADLAKQQEAFNRANDKNMADRGFSPETQRRIDAEMWGHKQRADAMNEQNTLMKENAKYQALHGTQDPNNPMTQFGGNVPSASAHPEMWPSLRADAEKLGQTLPQGLAQGIKKGDGDVRDAAGNQGTAAVDAAKKKTGSESPSYLTYQIGQDVAAGLVGGLGSGVIAASNGVLPIASNSGLAVGYQWARSMVTGADSVLKTADFTSAGFANIGSALAKTALGAAGLLGPAGGGASIYQQAGGNQGFISLGGGTPAAPVVNAEINVQVGNTPVEVIAQNVVNASFEQVADSITRQRGW